MSMPWSVSGGTLTLSGDISAAGALDLDTNVTAILPWWMMATAPSPWIPAPGTNAGIMLADVAGGDGEFDAYRVIPAPAAAPLPWVPMSPIPTPWTVSGGALTLGGDIATTGELDFDTNVNTIILVDDGDGTITLDTATAGDQRRHYVGGCRWRRGEFNPYG